MGRTDRNSVRVDRQPSGALSLQADGPQAGARGEALRGGVRPTGCVAWRQNEPPGFRLRPSDAGPELRPVYELLGRITGQIPSGQVNALFVNLGVSGEQEIRRALDLTRGSEGMTLEQAEVEAVEQLRFVIAERPERRLAILEAFGGAIEPDRGNTFLAVPE